MTENILDKPVTERFMDCLAELAEKGLIFPSFSLRNDGEALPLTDNLETTEKAQPKDSFDAAVEQHFQKGFNEFVKAREAKPAPKDSFDAAVQKRFAEL
jgi:hypothetical protein